jgi:hypothetical protein
MYQLLVVPIVLFLLEHFGRIYNVQIIRPTTYIDKLTQLCGFCWYYLGFGVACLLSLFYDIYKKFWFYFEEIKKTFTSIWTSFMMLCETPKQFIVGFYEKAADLVKEYTRICIFIVFLIVNWLIYQWSDTICYYVPYENCSWKKNFTSFYTSLFVMLMSVFIMFILPEEQQKLNSQRKNDMKTVRRKSGDGMY